MELLVPKYFPKFKCTADACRHNCCIGWEIDIDKETLADYRAMEGEIGDAVRESIEETAEGAHFRLQAGGRCANLDERGLCRIISALGEAHLCAICREHPRFYHEAADHWEGGLGAACEEAARLILAEEDYVTMVTEDGTPAEPPRRQEGFDVYTLRMAVYDILSDTSIPYAERKARMQKECGQPVLLPATEWENTLRELEYLEEAHRELFLRAAAQGQCTPPPEAERFLAYLIYRHTGTTWRALDFQTSVNLALQIEALFSAMVTALGLSPVEAARVLSEELEYSEANTAAIRFALDVENAFWG